MYRGFKEAVEGFTKNLFGVFRNSILLFIFIWTWLLLTMGVPFAYLLFHTKGPDPQLASLAFVLISITLLIWLVAFIKARVPAYLALLYPILLPVWFWLAMRSMFRVLTGKTTWKGRGLGNRRIKLI
jgi:chlorobactene glucosyltransferase